MKISNPRAILGQDGGRPFPVYLTLENTGSADRLTGVKSTLSEHVMVMGTEGENGAVVPAGSKPSFASDGAHIMMMGVEADLPDGSFVPLVLTFENAGDVPVKALVSRPVSEGPANGNGQADTAMMAHDMHGPGAVYDVAPGEPAPELSLAVYPLSDDGGYRVIVETANFVFFQPEGDLAPHAAGQGHGHLYLNGLKLQRMYGPEATIGALPPGSHIVRVTLNTNDHFAYAVNGESVTAQAAVEVQ